MQERFIAAIKEMKEVDQALRKAAAGEGITQENYLVYLVDQVHNGRLHRLINEFGYPSKKTVGEEVLIDFWLVVQHQDTDLQLQKDCLEKCDFEPEQRAYLSDRVSVNSDEAQTYGTQCYWDKEKEELLTRPLKDPEHVDELRKEVGLGPLKEYLESCRKKQEQMRKNRS